MRHGLLVLVLALAGCSGPPAGPLDDYTDEARARYPDLAALYGGEQGIYRGCGPNGGVCHNSSEFPALDSMGSIVENLGLPCNQKRDRADTIHDLCERPGDGLEIAGRTIELAWAIPDTRDDDALGRRWQLGLREPPGALDSDDLLEISRDGVALWHLGYYGTWSLDRDDPAGTTLVIEALPIDGDVDPAIDLRAALDGAGVPGDRTAVAVGDPNRNGVFGAALGGGIIVPGDPARSYLLHRLTDPSAGPLMPRANCCSWTKAAVRALWCWVDGLAPDGANATAPIDYGSCRPSPVVELLYPEPGPACASSGQCPVEAVLDDSDASFASIYAAVIVPRCSGTVCHDRGPVGGIDIATEATAFETLRAKVVPGDPDGSKLYQRISPELCNGDCQTMPLGREPLGDFDRERIRAWIEAGAPR